MNRKWQVVKYLVLDYLAAAISWTAFFVYRKAVIEPQRFGIDIPIEFTSRYYLGLVFIPLIWILFYYVTGFYDNIYRRSRLLELGQTFITSLAGVIVIFFALILDDYIESYKNYYQLFFTLFALHFGLTYTFRLILTSRTIHRIHHRKIGFNTLLIGSNEKAEKIFREMSSQKNPAGNLFTGYIGVENNDDRILGKYLPQLGKLNNLSEIIQKTR
jgi:FlaA1/EpsC-like NDP-sugar epimerase